MSAKDHKQLIRARDREAVALHAIEGISFDSADNELFAMFDREGWSEDQIRTYLHAKFGNGDATIAAE